MGIYHLQSKYAQVNKKPKHPLNSNKIGPFHVKSNIFWHLMVSNKCQQYILLRRTNTVLSRIVPSPLFFNLEIYHNFKIDIFLIGKKNMILSMEHRTCIPILLFVVFSWYLPIFSKYMNLTNFDILNNGSPSKIGLSPLGHNSRQ